MVRVGPGVDADGVGLTDLREGGGVDANGDGLVDGFVDLDGNGLDDGVMASPLPLPNTDGTGGPDFLDLDSDGDGLTDVVEADGTDADGDGRADGGDTNGNGLADSADPGAGGRPIRSPARLAVMRAPESSSATKGRAFRSSRVTVSIKMRAPMARAISARPSSGLRGRVMTMS